ncbi:M36 family metallopeptidase [Nocardioides marmorisolisilvae]|uniref:Bacillolysin n=1 Tax=Nocardioides marmorisolisilvae TaxID=1542737 RepID=A0A3N0DWY6_9ACTN|nr:M36 family metallopeptidase [Nocardioides marmorisolisilvae]RNL79953.1 bacillolysin [Nocardioides marmorisolisilvae]
MKITGPVTAVAASAALLAAVLVSPPAEATKPRPGTSTGTARIFMVNPVQSTGDETLTDQKDAASAVPASAYTIAQLRNLDGSGYLRGKWATVSSATGTPAFSSTNTFRYYRNQDQFEQVMAYYWVNQAQEYLQSLGFGSQFPGIVKQQFSVKVDQYGGDNSYQTDKPYRLRLGKGGVDDGEDAEVIVHEYGHAVHASQVPGFGASEEAGSIGEAWGDYFGVTVGLDAAKTYGWPVKADPSCPMDWDSTSYTDAPHCIRSFHTDKTVADKTGEVHADGEIWSQALWEIRLGYVALGKTTRAWDTTLIDSQFDYAPDTSFSAAAKATWAKAKARDGQAAADLVRARFAARGITF